MRSTPQLDALRAHIAANGPLETKDNKPNPVAEMKTIIDGLRAHIQTLPDKATVTKLQTQVDALDLKIATKHLGILPSGPAPHR